MAVTQPTRRGGVPGWIKGCGIALVIGVVLLIGTVVLFGVCTANVAKNISQNTGQQTSGACSPQPCANASGWNVYVSSVDYNAPSDAAPETGNVYVSMLVRFKNDTAKEQHANPVQFVLKDPAGVKHSVSYITRCESWSPVNLTTGASFGPKCIAFEVPKGTIGGLELTWTPGFADYTIKLQ